MRNDGRQVQDQPTPGGDPIWLRGLIEVLRVRRVGEGVQDACAFLGRGAHAALLAEGHHAQEPSDTRSPVGPNNR